MRSRAAAKAAAAEPGTQVLLIRRVTPAGIESTRRWRVGAEGTATPCRDPRAARGRTDAAHQEAEAELEAAGT